MARKRGTEIPTIDTSLITLTTSDGNELLIDTASKISVEVQTETTDAVKLIVKGVLRAQKRAKTTVTGNQITLTDNLFIPELVKILQGGTIKYNKIYTYEEVSSLSAGDYNILVGSKYVNFTLAKDLESGNTLVYNIKEDTLTLNGETIDTVSSTSATGTTLSCTTSDTEEIIGYAPPVSGSGEEGEAFTLNAYTAQYNEAGMVVQYEKIEYPNCTGQPVALSSEDGAFRAPEYVIDSAPAKGQAPYEISYVKSLPTFD